MIYGDRIEESYTFNSPGAKGLAADPGSQPEYARGRFEKYAEFGYDKGDSSSVENRMVNVAGSKGPSLIANLNEDVGFYEIKLDKVQSHSITTMVKEISKETTELTVVDVRKREETNSEETNTQ
ncbi:MAG: Lipase family protein [Patescibacteria group bacterium]|nr:Lipase family protein [Patescibacteria group bacterium]